MTKYDQAPLGLEGSQKLSSECFSLYLGQICWLMTISAEHKALPIKVIEDRVSPALLLKQFRIYLQGKQPVAAITWALVSDPIRKKFYEGQNLEFSDWRCGKIILIVDCISPFGSKEKIKSSFLSSFKSAISSSEVSNVSI